ncbi:MAG: hypothetical protein GY922_15180 [Proteobacteria bacterium]|nr:hypothetical protein [Pseudomonadota bacterium]
MEYFIADIKETTGSLEFVRTISITATSEEKARDFAQDVISQFYGDDGEPDSLGNGVYFELGTAGVHVRLGMMTKIDEHTFNKIKTHIRPVDIPWCE